MRLQDKYQRVLSETFFQASAVMLLLEFVRRQKEPQKVIDEFMANWRASAMQVWEMNSKDCGGAEKAVLDMGFVQALEEMEKKIRNILKQKV